MSDQTTARQTFIDRVENGTVLVLGGTGDARRTITVWRSRGERCWWVTDEGMDVARRAGMGPAINVALGRLGVDPKDPGIVRDDER